MSDDQFNSMTLEFYAKPATPEQGDPPRVAFMSGPRAGTFLEIRGGKTWFGRADSNEVVLDSPEVSKRHFFIEAGPDGACRLVDGESHNGTFVNRRQVQPGLPLSLTHGDTIAAAGFEMLFLHNRRTVEQDSAQEIALDGDRIAEEASRMLEGQLDIAELGRRRRERPTGR